MSTREKIADAWTREQRAKQFKEGIVPVINAEMQAKIDVQRKLIYEKLGMKLPEDLAAKESKEDVASAVSVPPLPSSDDLEVWAKDEINKIDF